MKMRCQEASRAQVRVLAQDVILQKRHQPTAAILTTATASRTLYHLTIALCTLAARYSERTSLQELPVLTSAIHAPISGLLQACNQMSAVSL